MATLEALEILKMVDEDTNWNDSDEGESGSDGEYSEEEDETDYLATTQVMYCSFVRVLVVVNNHKCG